MLVLVKGRWRCALHRKLIFCLDCAALLIVDIQPCCGTVGFFGCLGNGDHRFGNVPAVLAVRVRNASGQQRCLGLFTVDIGCFGHDSRLPAGARNGFEFIGLSGLRCCLLNGQAFARHLFPGVAGSLSIVVIDAGGRRGAGECWRKDNALAPFLAVHKVGDDLDINFCFCIILPYLIGGFIAGNARIVDRAHLHEGFSILGDIVLHIFPQIVKRRINPVCLGKGFPGIALRVIILIFFKSGFGVFPAVNLQGKVFLGPLLLRLIVRLGDGHAGLFTVGADALGDRFFLPGVVLDLGLNGALKVFNLDRSRITGQTIIAQDRARIGHQLEFQGVFLNADPVVLCGDGGVDAARVNRRAAIFRQRFDHCIVKADFQLWQIIGLGIVKDLLGDSRRVARFILGVGLNDPCAAVGDVCTDAGSV